VVSHLDLLSVSPWDSVSCVTLRRRFSFRLEEDPTRGVLSEVLSEVLKREKFQKKRSSKHSPQLSAIGGQPKETAKEEEAPREQC
jgi:hypothetical protein